MHNMREEVFRSVFRSRGIKAVSVAYVDWRVCIRYLTGEDVEGSVHNKRGFVKLYRVETAFRFLQGIGVSSVLVDIVAMSGARGLGRHPKEFGF